MGRRRKETACVISGVVGKEKPLKGQGELARSVKRERPGPYLMSKKHGREGETPKGIPDAQKAWAGKEKP